MIYKTDIDAQLDDYSALLDLYIERGKIPETYQDDPLSEYIGQQVETSRNDIDGNEDMREVFRENLLEFLRAVLPGFLEIQEQVRQEKEMIDAFFSADIQGRRRQWRQILSWLSYRYSASDFNVKGYERMFGDGSKTKEQVFSAMKENWEKCMLMDRLRQEQLLIEDGQGTQHVIACGRTDYEKKLKVNKIIFKYPQLDDILKKIGREHESDTYEPDSFIVTVHTPILLKHAKTRQEIDGVTDGRDLGALLPVEYAMMDQESFYVRYLRSELQQFSSKPPVESVRKTEIRQTPMPRLEKGPIILAIDTSGSMSGRPTEISKALLNKIIMLARRQKRSCFLITFSVRVKTLDIARPSQAGMVDKFFSNAYSGGTDGEQMFAEAINALQTKSYSMADVLVISDFCFREPNASTARRIREERAKGTRFYGLCIGGALDDYRLYLDNYWTI